MRGVSTFLNLLTLFVGVIAAMCVISLILSLQGCSSKEVVKYEQILIPTPQMCDFNISYEPQISTADLQSTLKSLTDLSFDSKELRRLIKATPCLNINYRELK